MPRYALGFCLWLLAMQLTGCLGLPSVAERTASADRLAAEVGWRRELLSGGGLDLVTYLPLAPRPAARLTVYIEGDGLAWISSSRPSLNPTPRTPLALQLALAQPTGNAVYLARPCQFIESRGEACQQGYWTDGRFAEAVIAASDRAIDQLKQRFAASELQLVGYSGGGAVATLLAARRKDVTSLVTVAGNLDHRLWTQMQRLTPLQHSLNPADARGALGGMRQWHLVGGRDRVVPAELAQHFIAGLPQPQLAHLQLLEAFDHHCCWVQDWPSLWPAFAE